MVKNQELVNARHAIGLYSIKELCEMFNCGRSKIDYGINNGELPYISPNNKDRFVYLKDFLEYAEIKKEDSRLSTEPSSQDAFRKTSC